jgi:dethiobiotin synthetase
LYFKKEIKKAAFCGDSFFYLNYLISKVFIKAVVKFPDLKSSDICPYFLKDAAAPHLVAVKESMNLDMTVMLEQYKLLEKKAQSIVVEGAGGFLVPINEESTLGDFAQAIKLPVILVVNIKLGCINHALLTAEAIERRGLHIFAWVANSTQPENEYTNQNIETLRTLLFKKHHAFLLGHIPFLNTISNHEIYNIDLLINTSKTLTLTK